MNQRIVEPEKVKQSARRTQEMAGNSAELKRLLGEIDKQKEVNEKLNNDIADKAKQIAALKAENSALSISLNGTYVKIRTLEASVNKENTGDDEVKTGYVSIASCPLPNGTKPLQVRVEGILVPRSIDEDGVCHEDVPVKTAIDMLSDGSGFQRFLTGPVNSITGKVKVGLYLKDRTYFRHKKRQYDGKYEFIRVLVEDPSKKA